jgi:hypothetical protein
MFKTFITATAIMAFSAFGAMAQETGPIEAVETAENSPISDYIEPVCAITAIILSERAVSACNGNADAMPAMLQDGSRLSNRGVGAEFNALLANVANFNG